MSKGKMLVGLLAGAAAGAIAGILLAPDKGSETRKNLSKRGLDTVDNLKSRASDMIETVADKYKGAREGSSQSPNRESGFERTRSTGSQNSDRNPGAPSLNSFV